MKEFEEQTYSASDVKAALRKDVLSPHDFGALLSPAARPYLEAMAQKAKAVRDRYFGNSVALFTPLYLANYCENYCIYCGFNCHNKIHRARLDLAQMEEEMKPLPPQALRKSSCSQAKAATCPPFPILEKRARWHAATSALSVLKSIP